MSHFFANIESADRYAKFRPKTHGIILNWLKDHCPARHFDNAIDIACGTGDSTRPLFSVADNVLGIDVSAAMLKHAMAKNIRVQRTSIDDLITEESFDLISTCMAWHWFNPETALKKYKELSRPDAIWIIYNFFFSGHKSSKQFNRWLRDQYLQKYPSPARHPSDHAIPKNDPDIELVIEDRGSIPIQFDQQSLVGYLTTQSNVEAVVRTGVDYADISRDITSSIADINLEGDFRYDYTFGIYRYVDRESQVGTK